MELALVLMLVLVLVLVLMSVLVLVYVLVYVLVLVFILILVLVLVLDLCSWSLVFDINVWFCDFTSSHSPPSLLLPEVKPPEDGFVVCLPPPS